MATGHASITIKPDVSEFIAALQQRRRELWWLSMQLGLDRYRKHQRRGLKLP